MSELRIIKEWKPEAGLEVPKEIKALYSDGDFCFLNPNQPYYVNKVSPDSGIELVKITDPKIKEKYSMFIEPGTGFFRKGDAVLAVQHKETKKAKDKYIQDLVDRKLPKVMKSQKGKFNTDNELAKAGSIKTEVIAEVTGGGKTQKLKV